MILFHIFLCVVVCVWGFLLYESAYWKGYDKADARGWKRLREVDTRWRAFHVERWSWLVGANARRKNMERALRAQQRKNDDLHKKLFKVGWELGSTLIRSSKLVEENASLEKRNRALAAELTSDLLSAQDREGVIKGLTRKL